VTASLRALFKPYMAEQSKLLMTMLGTAVAGLDRLDTIVPATHALLWTLEQGLGEAFTPDVREAWTVVFVVVSDTMKTAERAA
jgi:hypothetical protein